MVHVYVTSAFGKNNSGGNKAGVVLDSTTLTVTQKMEIARQLGYSETAFVSPFTLGDFRIEYFTPTDEVPLCGHATIATFATLYSLHKVESGTYTIETKAGILRIQIGEDGMIYMEQNTPIYGEELSPTLFSCMDTTPTSYPIQIVSTGLKDIIYPVDTLTQLESLQPDFKAMSELSKQLDVVGIHAFTLTPDKDITAICRNFAPLYGIDEESATGTASCALACYLFKHQNKQKEYTFEQGYNLNSISLIAVKLEYQEDTIQEVYVGGKGYLVCEMDIEV